MTRPHVSVIMPVYDGFEHLPEALESIRAQQQNVELIVVDDGSSEPVEPLVHSHASGAKVLRQENGGPSAARNAGLRHASGTFVCFLDADDIWADGALALLLKGFDDAPEAALVQGQIRRFGADESGPYAGYNLGAALIRRDALNRVGGFDEQLRHSEDVDLFMSLEQAGLLRLVIPQLVLNYRRRPGSLSSDTSGRAAAKNWIQRLHARRSAAPDVLPPVSLPNDFSVLLVVRNGRRFLPEALRCLREQTLAPQEIVAVVGPSTDGTLDYLAAQPDVRTVEQVGSGLANARNQAVVLASGSFLAFYDHDDLWEARKLELQRRAVDLFAKPGCAITYFELFSGDRPNSSDRRQPRLGWTPSALFAHRDLVEAIGPFDPDLGFGCDSDWFRRLRLADAPCAVASRTLLWKRLHDTNLSASPQDNRAVMFRMLKKHRSEQKGGA